MNYGRINDDNSKITHNQHRSRSINHKKTEAIKGYQKNKRIKTANLVELVKKILFTHFQRHFEKNSSRWYLSLFNLSLGCGDERDTCV